MQLYEKERERIMGIFRSEALIPVAEAFHSMGDGVHAEAMYRLAVEEGASNPNARPRCDDTVAACLSMAREGFQPSEELEKRILEISKGLKNPW